jgi:pyruvate dehydrogenase E2 component (dihydrolipoamide acetyltransferase)
MQALDSGRDEAIPASGGNPWETPVQILRMSPMRKAIARQLSLSEGHDSAFLPARRRARRCTVSTPQPRKADRYGTHRRSMTISCARPPWPWLEVPDVNIQVHDDAIHRFAHADISVAVATDKGLITPIVRAADTKSVAEIAMESRLLAQRARAGQAATRGVPGRLVLGLEPRQVRHRPVRRDHQSTAGAILAIGAIRIQPTLQNHALAFSSVVNVSLSCDHRAIDGAVGAGFVAALRDLLEAPEQLIGIAD